MYHSSFDITVLSKFDVTLFNFRVLHYLRLMENNENIYYISWNGGAEGNLGGVLLRSVLVGQKLCIEGLIISLLIGLELLNIRSRKL